MDSNRPRRFPDPRAVLGAALAIDIVGQAFGLISSGSISFLLVTLAVLVAVLLVRLPGFSRVPGRLLHPRPAATATASP